MKAALDIIVAIESFCSQTDQSAPTLMIPLLTGVVSFHVKIKFCTIRYTKIDL